MNTTKTTAEQLERANRAVLLWSQTPRNQYSTELCDMLGESLRVALGQLDEARAALAAQQPAMEVLQQALTDPENQPSQFGTVPLAQHEREIARLHEEAAESDATRLRMADLLNRTANAIRGEPADGVRWSWGDLPDRAQAAMNMLSGAMALAAQQPAADELQRLQDRLRVAETALAVYQRAEAQGELQPAASGEPAAQILRTELETERELHDTTLYELNRQAGMHKDEVQRLRTDAERYRWLRDRFAWHRGAAPDDEDEARAFASVPFPYRTDLSCAAMLDYAIDKAAAQGGPASTTGVAQC